MSMQCILHVNGKSMFSVHVTSFHTTFLNWLLSSLNTQQFAFSFFFECSNVIFYYFQFLNRMTRSKELSCRFLLLIWGNHSEIKEITSICIICLTYLNTKSFYVIIYFNTARQRNTHLFMNTTWLSSCQLNLKLGIAHGYVFCYNPRASIVSAKLIMEVGLQTIN